MAPVFEGRETELGEIERRLNLGHNRLLLVNGEGGIGKTSLAGHYFCRYAEYYQHLAWVLTAGDIAQALLDNLSDALGLAFEPTHTKLEKLNKLLTSLANLKQPCLLVIDNANDLQDLQNHYPLLRRCSNFHILLTTRIAEYTTADYYRIEILPLATAQSLFETYYRKKLSNTDKSLFKSIYHAVGGNTLVIEVLAKYLHNSNRLSNQYSLKQLLIDLQQHGLLSFAKSQLVDIHYQQLYTSKPEDVIAAMYDLSGLSREQVALLSVFAVLPAERITWEGLQTLLANQELETTLLSLVQIGWLEQIQQDDKTHLKCHPVIQHIVRKKNPQLRSDCEGLIDALQQGLDPDNQHHNNYQTALIYSGFAKSVFYAFKNSVDFDLLLLCQGIGTYATATGDLALAFEYYQHQLHASQQLLQTEPENPVFKNGLAISYSKMGETYAALGDLQQALGFHQDETQLFEQLYKSYPSHVGFKNSLAISYEKLGQTHSALGDLQQALGFYEQRRKLSEQLHEAYPRNVGFKNGLAISYSKLGEIHTALEDLQQALGFYEQRRKLGEQLYEAYPSNVDFKNGLAISYSKLGDTHSALGDLQQALGFYEQRRKLGEQLHEAYPSNVGFKNGLAISYFKLGETHAVLGDLQQALGFYEKDAELSKQLHTAYPLNIGFKNGLAVAYAKLGDFNQEHMKESAAAIGYYQQAENLLQELVRDSPQYVGYQCDLRLIQQVLQRICQ